MKKNKLLILPLLACSLLTGCDENTFVQNGSNPVGNVNVGDTNLQTVLNLQKFYEDLKESNGGAVAVEKGCNGEAHHIYLFGRAEGKCHGELIVRFVEGVGVKNDVDHALWGLKIL